MNNLPQVAELNNRIIQLSRLLKLVRHMVNRIIRNKNINIQFDQLPVLLCIYTHGMVCQQEIASILLRDKSSVLRSVKSLHQKGYVFIIRDESDARKRQLWLTPDGKQLAYEVIDFMPDFEQAWTEIAAMDTYNEIRYASQLYI